MVNLFWCKHKKEIIEFFNLQHRVILLKDTDMVYANKMTPDKRLVTNIIEFTNQFIENNSNKIMSILSTIN